MTLLELLASIFTFNLLTFGNGPAMIPMLQDSLVDQRGVLTTEQLLYAFAIARVTPGQANVYVASVGYFLFGLAGALLSTLAIQLPGYLMLPVLRGFQSLRGAAWVKRFTRGLTTASVGLIFAAVVGIAQRTLTGLTALVVFVLALALMLIFKRGQFTSMIIASVVGLLMAWLLYQL